MTVNEFAGKFEKTSVALKKAAKPAVTDAAKVLQKGAEMTLNAAAPGGRLRNVGAKKLSGGMSGPVKSAGGTVLRVSTSVKGEGFAATGTVKAVGNAYAILDNPTPPHWIGMGKSTHKLGKNKKTGLKKQGPAMPGMDPRPLNIGGKWVMGPVLHPGTKGKHTFNLGVEAATPEAMVVMRKGFTLPVEGIFH